MAEMQQDKGAVVITGTSTGIGHAAALLLDQFGLRLTPEYEGRLDREVEKMQRYRSRHEYSGDQCSVARKRIVADLRPLFGRFGFDMMDATYSAPLTSAKH